MGSRAGDELAGQDDVVATWILQSRAGCGAVRCVLQEPGCGVEESGEGRVCLFMNRDMMPIVFCDTQAEL